ncbi:hypothetical protein A3Q56_03986 [Intoshia linei]|uniref:Uncharacterized protein n=1 Tax=Intoshia linei TaxID=1819745 RepID=A0A177B1Y1_9BILA|nr:hypothetical protein A3Q56_03986 [Intoshia linei]
MKRHTKSNKQKNKIKLLNEIDQNEKTNTNQPIQPKLDNFDLNLDIEDWLTIKSNYDHLDSPLENEHENYLDTTNDRIDKFLEGRNSLDAIPNPEMESILWKDSFWLENPSIESIPQINNKFEIEPHTNTNPLANNQDSNFNFSNIENNDYDINFNNITVHDFDDFEKLDSFGGFCNYDNLNTIKFGDNLKFTQNETVVHIAPSIAEIFIPSVYCSVFSVPEKDCVVIKENSKVAVSDIKNIIAKPYYTPYFNDVQKKYYTKQKEQNIQLMCSLIVICSNVKSFSNIRQHLLNTLIENIHTGEYINNTFNLNCTSAFHTFNIYLAISFVQSFDESLLLSIKEVNYVQVNRRYLKSNLIFIVHYSEMRCHYYLPFPYQILKCLTNNLIFLYSDLVPIGTAKIKNINIKRAMYDIYSEEKELFKLLYNVYRRFKCPLCYDRIVRLLFVTKQAHVIKCAFNCLLTVSKKTAMYNKLEKLNDFVLHTPNFVKNFYFLIGNCYFKKIYYPIDSNELEVNLTDKLLVDTTKKKPEKNVIRIIKRNGKGLEKLGPRKGKYQFRKYETLPKPKNVRYSERIYAKNEISSIKNNLPSNVKYTEVSVSNEKLKKFLQKIDKFTVKSSKFGSGFRRFTKTAPVRNYSNFPKNEIDTPELGQKLGHYIFRKIQRDDKKKLKIDVNVFLNKAHEKWCINKRKIDFNQPYEHILTHVSDYYLLSVNCCGDVKNVKIVLSLLKNFPHVFYDQETKCSIFQFFDKLIHTLDMKYFFIIKKNFNLNKSIILKALNVDSEANNANFNVVDENLMKVYLVRGFLCRLEACVGNTQYFFLLNVFVELYIKCKNNDYGGIYYLLIYIENTLKNRCLYNDFLYVISLFSLTQHRIKQFSYAERIKLLYTDMKNQFCNVYYDEQANQFDTISVNLQTCPNFDVVKVNEIKSGVEDCTLNIATIKQSISYMVLEYTALPKYTRNSIVTRSAIFSSKDDKENENRIKPPKTTSVSYTSVNMNVCPEMLSSVKYNKPTTTALENQHVFSSFRNLLHKVKRDGNNVLYLHHNETNEYLDGDGEKVFQGEKMDGQQTKSKKIETQSDDTIIMNNFIKSDENEFNVIGSNSTYVEVSDNSDNVLINHISKSPRNLESHLYNENNDILNFYNGYKEEPNLPSTLDNYQSIDNKFVFENFDTVNIEDDGHAFQVEKDLFVEDEIQSHDSLNESIKIKKELDVNKSENFQPDSDSVSIYDENFFDGNCQQFFAEAADRDQGFQNKREDGTLSSISTEHAYRNDSLASNENYDEIEQCIRNKIEKNKQYLAKFNQKTGHLSDSESSVKLKSSILSAEDLSKRLFEITNKESKEDVDPVVEPKKVINEIPDTPRYNTEPEETEIVDYFPPEYLNDVEKTFFSADVNADVYHELDDEGSNDEVEDLRQIEKDKARHNNVIMLNSMEPVDGTIFDVPHSVDSVNEIIDIVVQYLYTQLPVKFTEDDIFYDENTQHLEAIHRQINDLWMLSDWKDSSQESDEVIKSYNNLVIGLACCQFSNEYNRFNHKSQLNQFMINRIRGNVLNSLRLTDTEKKLGYSFINKMKNRRKFFRFNISRVDCLVTDHFINETERWTQFNKEKNMVISTVNDSIVSYLVADLVNELRLIYRR